MESRWGKAVMRRLWAEVDLHVAAMLGLLSPALCVSWWWLLVPLLISQGRICVRAFLDYPAFGRRPWTYLVANELLVVAAVGTVAVVRFTLGFL
jgi:hypothetical protein